MARMRSLKLAYQYVKDKDPQTALTMYTLRKMVTKGIIPSYGGNGAKYFIDLDALETVLTKSTTTIQTIRQKGKWID